MKKGGKKRPLKRVYGLLQGLDRHEQRACSGVMAYVNAQSWYDTAAVLRTMVSLRLP